MKKKAACFFEVSRVILFYGDSYSDSTKFNHSKGYVTVVRNLLFCSMSCHLTSLSALLIVPIVLFSDVFQLDS